jgi:2',3'-cyclic-nucleotide 2'-phosphodiesterase (5'-nucleotidase family)
MPVLTVFHTNDLHNSLNEEKAARLKAFKEQTPNSLLLDAGDAIRAGNLGVSICGEPALRLMSDAGYDAMAMGNREFHFLQAGLKSKIGCADFPVLCANIRPVKRGERVPVIPWITKTVADVRVAIFGLTVPMITERMLARKVSAYVFDDPVETASRLVPELRGSHDLVIALTHIGVKEDRRLASSVSGIDLIVGGHTHVTLDPPEMVDAAVIAQAGYWGHSFGRIEITIAGNEVRVTGGIMEL